MPKTVTLSDADLAALQAIRQPVADVPHPARPAAVALIDRINAAPEDGPLFPVVTRSGALPTDLSQPDGYRTSMVSWDNTLGNPTGDIAIPTASDLRLAVVRPNDDVVICWPLDAGAAGRGRALYELRCTVSTRPLR